MNNAGCKHPDRWLGNGKAPCSDCPVRGLAGTISQLPAGAATAWPRPAQPRPSSSSGAAIAPDAVLPAQPARTLPRPSSLSEVVGQAEVIEQLRTVVRGARLRNVPPPHVLLAGPAGTGKTTLAQVIAQELGTTLVVANGVMLSKPSDLVGVLLKLQPGAVLFLDEVHALPRKVQEVLYTALEDGTVSLVLGRGTEARAHVAHLPAWTCVAATTAPGQLTQPFRDRFGFSATLRPYELEELAEIVRRAWDKQSVTYDTDAPAAVAQRCKGVPRIALQLSERVLDYCAVNGVPNTVPKGAAAMALDAFGLDEHGFDHVDWRILRVLTDDYAGVPVGIDALAQAVGLDKSSLEAHEGPLITQGLLARTKGGRLALPKAYQIVQQHKQAVATTPPPRALGEPAAA